MIVYMVCRYAKKKPCNLTLVSSSETIPHKRSVGEDGRAASSGQSSPLLSSPFRTSSAMTCRSPGQLKGGSHFVSCYYTSLSKVQVVL